MFQHKLYIEDIMMYILASLPNPNFYTSDVNLLFYKLKQKYPDFFKDLYFYNNCQPCSENIYSLVMRAHISKLFENGNYFSDLKKKGFINYVDNNKNVKLTPEQKLMINEIINTIKTEKLI
jgi:hypothetical protein